MDFSSALLLLKKGQLVARKGWNGKDMFLEAQYPDAHSKMGHPYIYIKGVDDKLTPWVPSSGDLFAEDWETVER